MNNINLDKIVNYNYFALLLLLPLSTFLTNVALISLTIFVLISRKRAYPIKQVFGSSLWVFFIYIIFIGIFSYNIEAKEYLKLLPLLIIPFTLSYIKLDILKKGLYFLLIAITLVQLISIAGIFNYYYFSEGKTVALRSYAGINEILRFERPYLGFFSALNIIIAYKLLRQKKLLLFVAISMFSIFIIILISARLGLLLAIINTVAIFLFEIKISFKYLAISFLSVSVLSVIFFKSNSPLKNRFQQLKYDTRLVIWEGASKIYNDEATPILGLKSQKAVLDKLLNYYENDASFIYQPDKVRFISKKYNTHNQYINEILRGGILGVLFLVSPFFILIYNNIKSGNLFFVLLLTSILLFFMVENLLARQIGVYTVATILSLSRKSSYEKT